MHSLRIRTITVFLELGSSDSWEQQVASAGAFLAQAQQHYEALGYEVQTVRLATQPFPHFLGEPSPALIPAAVRLEQLAKAHGIPLLSIGSSDRPDDLEHIPGIIAATSSTSCSYALPPDAPLQLVQAAAAAVLEVARRTDGHGNFRFAVSANCGAGIPYFPVACASSSYSGTFALGTECDTLLHQAFTTAAGVASAATVAAAAPGVATNACSTGPQQQGGLPGASSSPAVPGCVLAQAHAQLSSILLEHFRPLQAAALELEAASIHSSDNSQLEGSGTTSSSSRHKQPPASNLKQQQQQPIRFRYAGLDTSLAPGLDTPALTASYETLGLGPFGGPGTLAISSLITQVLKQLPLRLTGYCGLMLAVCEDAGLAVAAAEGRLSVPQLLQWSAVCGCGLDTVPVPGPALPAASADHAGAGVLTPEQQRHDQQLMAQVAGVLLDTAALAWRLQKPLACRLLPQPGRAAGDITGFTNPYLINSRVMSLAGGSDNAGLHA